MIWVNIAESHVSPIQTHCPASAVMCISTFFFFDELSNLPQTKEIQLWKEKHRMIQQGLVLTWILLTSSAKPAEADFRSQTLRTKGMKQNKLNNVLQNCKVSLRKKSSQNCSCSIIHIILSEKHFDKMFHLSAQRM